MEKRSKTFGSTLSNGTDLASVFPELEHAVEHQRQSNGKHSQTALLIGQLSQHHDSWSHLSGKSVEELQEQFGLSETPEELRKHLAAAEAHSKQVRCDLSRHASQQSESFGNPSASVTHESTSKGVASSGYKRESYADSDSCSDETSACSMEAAGDSVQQSDECSRDVEVLHAIVRTKNRHIEQQHQSILELQAKLQHREQAFREQQERLANFQREERESSKYMLQLHRQLVQYEEKVENLRCNILELEERICDQNAHITQLHKACGGWQRHAAIQASWIDSALSIFLSLEQELRLRQLDTRGAAESLAWNVAQQRSKSSTSSSCGSPMQQGVSPAVSPTLQMQSSPSDAVELPPESPQHDELAQKLQFVQCMGQALHVALDLLSCAQEESMLVKQQADGMDDCRTEPAAAVRTHTQPFTPEKPNAAGQPPVEPRSDTAALQASLQELGTGLEPCNVSDNLRGASLTGQHLQMLHDLVAKNQQLVYQLTEALEKLARTEDLARSLKQQMRDLKTDHQQQASAPTPASEAPAPAPAPAHSSNSSMVSDFDGTASTGGEPGRGLAAKPDVQNSGQLQLADGDTQGRQHANAQPSSLLDQQEKGPSQHPQAAPRTYTCLSGLSDPWPSLLTLASSPSSVTSHAPNPFLTASPTALSQDSPLSRQRSASFSSHLQPAPGWAWPRGPAPNWRHYYPSSPLSSSPLSSSPLSSSLISPRLCYRQPSLPRPDQRTPSTHALLSPDASPRRPTTTLGPPHPSATPATPLRPPSPHSSPPPSSTLSLTPDLHPGSAAAAAATADALWWSSGPLHLFDHHANHDAATVDGLSLSLSPSAAAPSAVAPSHLLLAGHHSADALHTALLLQRHASAGPAGLTPAGAASHHSVAQRARDATRSASLLPQPMLRGVMDGRAGSLSHGSWSSQGGTGTFSGLGLGTASWASGEAADYIAAGGSGSGIGSGSGSGSGSGQSFSRLGGGAAAPLAGLYSARGSGGGGGSTTRGVAPGAGAGAAWPFGGALSAREERRQWRGDGGGGGGPGPGW